MKVDLALRPRSGFFCKDGRGWMTSELGRARTLDWPPPTVLRGALVSAWGRSPEADVPLSADAWRAAQGEVSLGASLPLRRPPGAAWGAAHRMWPVPADALYLAGRKTVHRLDPRPLSARTLGRDGRSDDPRERLWYPSVDDASKPLAPPRWWTDEAFARWLAGGAVPTDVVRDASVKMPVRHELHVGIDPFTFAAQDKILWAAAVTDTLSRDGSDWWEWAIAARVALPPGTAEERVMAWRAEPVLLGGKSRVATVDSLDETLWDAPEALEKAVGPAGVRGLRLVVVTPAVFGRGWLPDGFELDASVAPEDGQYRGTLPGVDGRMVLRAALVPRATATSGWDMLAHGARKTLRTVPPGAVYFVEKADGAVFTSKEVRRLWLAALGERTNEGWGRVAPGVWTP